MMLIYLEAEQGTFLENLQIVRGPYLQVGTESSIIIRWATDAPIHGKVWYGTNPDRLDLTQEETTITCDHTVKLTELTPDTKYYYAIGTTTGVQAGGTEDYFFVTAPSQNLAPEQVRPLRILVLGDAGRGNDIAASVRDGYLKFTQTRHTDLWLMLGDNAYDTGTYEEYQRGIFEMYPQFLRSSVLWTAIGNHDGGSADSLLQTGPYYELFTMPTRGEAGGVPSGTAAYYSFDYGNIHFICLDSYGSDGAERPPQGGDRTQPPPQAGDRTRPPQAGDRTQRTTQAGDRTQRTTQAGDRPSDNSLEEYRAPQGAMLTWLARDIAASDKDWKIAFWHHPPYTKGSHDSDTEIELIEIREHALPILEAAGVDLVLAGHSHSYERSYLIDGHYGTSDTFTQEMKKDGGSGREDESTPYQKPLAASQAGTVYIVAGTSALADQVSPHPAMYTSLSIPGSLVLDVHGKRLDVKFIDDQGEVQDYFTMKKTIA